MAERNKHVLAADFDGTLLAYDLAEKVLTKFARDGWRRYDILLARGKITLEECMRRQYGMINVASSDEIIDYAERFCVFRPGIRKLLSECNSRGVELFVVSAGLDFCIEHAFKVNGLALPNLISPRSLHEKDGGFVVTFPEYPFPEAANYKEGFVLSRQSRGDFVTFVGNGMGDLHASLRANEVFAIKDSTLDRICEERGLPHRSIKTLVPLWRSLASRKSAR